MGRVNEPRSMVNVNVRLLLTYSPVRTAVYVSEFMLTGKEHFPPEVRRWMICYPVCSNGHYV